MKLEKESKFLEYKTGKGKLPTSLWETYRIKNRRILEYCN